MSGKNGPVLSPIDIIPTCDEFAVLALPLVMVRRVWASEGTIAALVPVQMAQTRRAMTTLVNLIADRYHISVPR
jgi:hypothetical protein